MSGRWLILAACLSIAPGPVRALSPADIRGQAQDLGAELNRLRRAGPPSPTDEQGLIDRLGQLVLAFIDQSERAARTGSERQQRDALRPAFEAVLDPLNGIYARHSDRLDRMAREIMDQDGDLEALYETSEWRESQAVAARALYFLNWLNYYGARLYEGARRKERLAAAERGFSEFAVGDRRTELLTESVLGRGLCHLELGNHDWAIRDFRIVIDTAGAAAERKAKARLALLEAYSRAGKVRDALRSSRELLRGGELAPADAALVRFFRLRALFDALQGASGSAAEQYRREALEQMEQLRRAGRGWAEKADALMLSRIDDPAQWANKATSPLAKWELAKLLLQKNDDARAVPLLEAVIASRDSAVKGHRAEANYWLGVVRFKAGEYARAAAHLEAALGERKTAFAADASFMRFKALEALMAQDATAELGERYAAAMRELLQRYPEHPAIHEVHYRLGEYLQGQQMFEAAIDAYAKVSGAPGFELRARFGTLQCEFERLKAQLDPPAREALLARIGEDLARFWQQARALGRRGAPAGAPLKEFQAKATVFEAVYASLRGRDGDAEVAKLLADFEQQYPEQRELLPQVIHLRLAALRRLARFGEAEQEVTKHAAVLRAEGRSEALERLAGDFAKAAARRRAGGDSARARAAEQVALRLYEVLLSHDGAADDRTKLALARLYESSGELGRADALYQEVLRASGGSLTALRGLARVAEGQTRLEEAIDYWRRFTEATRPGDPPWYEGQYQQARLVLARGEQKRSCRMLSELRPAMPGLGDAGLRRQLAELYRAACE